MPNPARTEELKADRFNLSFIGANVVSINWIINLPSFALALTFKMFALFIADAIVVASPAGSVTA